MTRFLNLKTFV